MTATPAPGEVMSANGRAIVLLSGGLDSVVSAAWATKEFRDVLALTVDYGQRAAAAELRAAEAVAGRLGCRWMSVELPWLGGLGGSALTNRRQPMPRLSEAELANRETTQRSAEAVWVPNRNGVLVAVAGAYADAWRYSHILLGLNREEGATFPDNTPAFAEAATQLLGYSTRVHPIVLSPTAELTKREIVELGMQLGAPLELVWSCYESGDRHCWQCESCRRLKRALEEAGAWPDKGPSR